MTQYQSGFDMEMTEIAAMILRQPKIDCHCHVLDPAIFPYSPDSRYKPAGQEIGTLTQMNHVFAAYGVRNALIVQPNSGYGEDNRCMLSALAAGAGRFKGVAVVSNDITLDELASLKAQGVVGVAFNLTFHGIDFYLRTESLLAKLEELDMFLQLQFEDQQLLGLLPLLEKVHVRLLIDHCGRPNIAAGVDQPGFRVLLDLGRSGRAFVKLSGYSKFSQLPLPYEDTWPFVHKLVNAFTPEACMWASDWPYLRAPERLDYGPLLTHVALLFPDQSDRKKLFWDTPQRLFGFLA